MIVHVIYIYQAKRNKEHEKVKKKSQNKCSQKETKKSTKYLFEQGGEGEEGGRTNDINP